ncbi:MAG: flagellar M-ring protein FliF [Acetobacteraceae bacterium]|nr:flagellar M-ring protein FliF [Acetobacteraceae bacterium]
MNALLEGLRALGAARLVAMAVVGVGLLGLLGMLALRGGSERMALLYGELDTREAGQIAELLDRQKIAHQIGAGGSQILVPAEQVARLRVMLAREGLPSGGSIGYELLDRGDGITASQFQQKMAETRAMEGEIARSIRTIAGVKAARVHLVLPRREPFAREKQEAQASVMLTTAGAARLDREAIQAIVNLVAGAVPGLRPRGVSVVDSRGTLLARAGEAAAANAAMGGEELRRATEMRLSRAVEEMLERSVGQGRVRAEASVQMDFERVQETSEKFDPDGQVVRSTQSVTDNSKTTEQAATVSVQNNLPNADAGKDAAGSTEARQEETTNYEIGKTVRTLVREQPQIRRLSIAVLVDGIEEKGADGVLAWKPRSAEELERIARLVRSAVGYEEKRGDLVEVVTMRFTGDADVAGLEPRGFLGLGIDTADIARMAQTAVVGLIAVLALLLVFRPMVMRVTALGAKGLAAGAIAALPGGGAMAVGADGTITAASLGMAADVTRLLEGPSGARAPGGGGGAGDDFAAAEDESLVSLRNVEGQLRASAVRRLAEMVDRHPEESLTIVRAWMQEGSG